MDYIGEITKYLKKYDYTYDSIYYDLDQKMIYYLFFNNMIVESNDSNINNLIGCN